MAGFTNISAYLFARLERLKFLKEDLLKFCKERDLKGTILLAPEGINLFVAGRPAAVEELVSLLRAIPGLSGLHSKYSESEDQPFSRMLVRLKKEIIAFGVEGIDPVNQPSPRLKPAQLKEWLDQGKPLVLLDTRNDYEIKLGTFKGALPAGIDHFRKFPEAVAGLPEELRETPVVTFCTGGIRCEKAAPLMEKIGFKEVYQLEGGILKYFEEVGGDHYEGECFVFDQRVGLDPALRETGSAVCFCCQAPLTADELADPRYVEGESCPHCYRSDHQRRAEKVMKRQDALDKAVSPLPGSIAYDNRKPIRIPKTCEGMGLLDALDKLFSYLGRDEWCRRIDAGRILDPQGKVASAGRKVRAGEQYVRLMPETIEPDVASNVGVIDEDDAVVVIDKPAPLPMHACGRFNRNTLEYFLRKAWHPEVPRPAHRLDANTTGLVVCARTRQIAKILQPQFSRGEVEKTYLAKVWGAPEENEFVIRARISSEAGKLGAREIDEDAGQEAVTEVKVVRRNDDGTSLIELRPLTGRTNQIRIHLWEAACPIIGDPVYLRGGARGDCQTMALGDEPMCLHAWKLAFIHPHRGERVRYETPLPAWAAALENH
ncbi:sulfurtransferase [Haloferula chungangensis]|uniref:tRNA uridine(34) hydroxylase n=1 Tax=Haloferula chungangensis TaxID=1048331 RepID=A0ABW2KZM4_9BACT